jgi:hypothetical protein
MSEPKKEQRLYTMTVVCGEREIRRLCTHAKVMAHRYGGNVEVDEGVPVDVSADVDEDAAIDKSETQKKEA